MPVAGTALMLPRRPRLKDFSYVGRHRYLLTFCTSNRRHVFVSDQIVSLVWSQILHAADECAFTVSAHVLMPDHVHLLVQASADSSDLRKFATLAKQRSGYEYARRVRHRLWQPSYWDHVLRDDESTLPAIRYILENPVRARLVASPEQYPYVGAGDVPVGEMMDRLCAAGIQVWRRPAPDDR